MSTHLSGFQSFSGFLHHFVLVKLAISSRRFQPALLLPAASELAAACVVAEEVTIAQLPSGR